MYSPRPVDSEGTIFFQRRSDENFENNRRSSPISPASRSTRSRNSPEIMPLLRPLSPEILIRNKPKARPSPRSTCSPRTARAELGQTDSTCMVQNANSVTDRERTEPSLNKDVTGILANITDVLTEMSGQLKSIKSSQRITQNPEIQNDSQFERAKTTSHIVLPRDVVQSEYREAGEGRFSRIQCSGRQSVANSNYRSIANSNYRSNLTQPQGNGDQNAHNNFYAQNRDISSHERYPQPVIPTCHDFSRSIQATPMTRPVRFHDLGGIKINHFTGDSEWKTWYARFETIVQRFGLTDEEKLDQLLPRIDGKAAEFVFTQLPPTVLRDYRTLIQELNCRYRVIETSRSFAAKFSRRSQRVGETVEEYASELKVLYDKAHGYRDRQTRNEDLVRRFLDGLRDDDIRFEVEYHKEPETIDEAVFHVVNFMQTRSRKDIDRRSRENARSRDDLREVKTDGKVRFAPDRDMMQLPSEHQTATQSNENFNSLWQKLRTETDKMAVTLENVIGRLEKIEKANRKVDNNESKARKDKRGAVECFNCHESGHFARDCPSKHVNQTGSRNSYSKQSKNESGNLNYRGPSLAAKERSN